MDTYMVWCPTCKEATAHQSDGTKRQEPDGRVSQTAQCQVCHTWIKVYFNPLTNEFQRNLEECPETDVDVP
jgi:hypothetical protein